jgi:hypothetical protein
MLCGLNTSYNDNDDPENEDNHGVSAHGNAGVLDEKVKASIHYGRVYLSYFSINNSMT